MNKLYKTLLTLFLGMLLIIPTFAANSAEETIDDIIESLGEVQEKFSKLSPSESEEAIIIDQAIKELNKSTEFALENIDKEDITTATLALSFVNKSLSDVGKIVPKEFESDMSNADIENFAPEKMETLKEITTAMHEKKQEDKNLFLDQIIELNDIGFNSREISDRLASLGVDTVTMIELNNRKFDKIKNEIVDNQLEISSKEESLKSLKQQIEPLDSQRMSLNSEKQAITNKYNAELAKQEDISISAEDLNKSQNLAEQFNKEIENASIQISTINSQASSLTSKINALNLELNQLREVQEIAAVKAKELVPDAVLTAAKVGVASLGKSETDWANSWKGDLVTTKIIDDNVVNLSADEIQSVKADLAMESAMQALTTGKISKDLDIGTSALLSIVDVSVVQGATAAAAQEAIAEIQEYPGSFATRVGVVAETIQSIDTSSVSEDVSNQLKGVLANNSLLIDNARREGWADVVDVENYLGISVDAITQDTSSWTEAEWAASWKGDAATGGNAAESQAIAAGLAQSQAQKVLGRTEHENSHWDESDICTGCPD